MLDVGWRIWDAEYGIQAMGWRLWDGGYGMQDMGYRLWDAGPSDPAPGRHFPMPLTWSSLARINWCLHGAFPVCKAADGSRSGAVCFGALQSSAAVQEGCAVCIRSLQLCMLLHGPFATTGLQAGGVQHVVGVVGGNKGARSWGCKKETVQQGAGGCKKLELQEASRVQPATGIARSKQGARSWDCKKRTVKQAAVGCKKQRGCKMLGLQEANSAASSCGLQEASRLQHAAVGCKKLELQEATRVQHAAGVAGSKQGARSSWDCKEQTVQQAAVGCKKQQGCCMQLGLQEASRVLHATGVARSK